MIDTSSNSIITDASNELRKARERDAAIGKQIQDAHNNPSPPAAIQVNGEEWKVGDIVNSPIDCPHKIVDITGDNITASPCGGVSRLIGISSRWAGWRKKHIVDANKMVSTPSPLSEASPLDADGLPIVVGEMYEHIETADEYTIEEINNKWSGYVRCVNISGAVPSKGLRRVKKQSYAECPACRKDNGHFPHCYLHAKTHYYHPERGWEPRTPDATIYIDDPDAVKVHPAKTHTISDHLKATIAKANAALSKPIDRDKAFWDAHHKKWLEGQKCRPPGHEIDRIDNVTKDRLERIKDWTDGDVLAYVAKSDVFDKDFVEKFGMHFTRDQIGAILLDNDEMEMDRLIRGKTRSGK